MKTIGQIFREKREEKKLSLEDIEKATKIRQKFLQALEKDEFDKLPVFAFTRGFVKNYSEFLDLSVSEMLALYRRQFDEKKDERLTIQASQDAEALVTPKRLSISFIVFLVLIFSLYLLRSYIQLSQAPYLMVLTPSENAVVENSEIKIAGKTDPENRVFINNQEVVLKDGVFEEKIILSEGLNTITIKAVNRQGKTNTIERHIRLGTP